MLPPSDLEQLTGVGKRAVHTCFISKHVFNGHINSPSPFSFMHSRSKSTVFFPIEEVSTFSREKAGHCGYHDFLGPNPLLNRLSARTGSLLGPPHEAAHYTKTTREPTRQGSPKTRVGSRVPPVGHLTTYGKIRKVYIYPLIS